MDKELVETVARAMQRQYGKQVQGEIQKWEKRTPGERSAWRLIARTAIDLVVGWEGTATSPRSHIPRKATGKINTGP
jgi:hypothetical protein